MFRVLVPLWERIFLILFRFPRVLCRSTEPIQMKSSITSIRSKIVQIVVQMYLSVSMQRELSLNFHRNNVYGHLDQVSRTCVYFHFQFTHIWFCKLAPSAHIRYFCAHAALVLADTFAPLFASIQ